MNKKMTKYIIGKMLGVEAILLLIPMMVGLMYSEKESASTRFLRLFQASPRRDRLYLWISKVCPNV